MGQETRNDELVQRAARNLFEGTAPERAAELHALWDQYQPRFNVLPNAGVDGSFVFDAGAYRYVRFNHRVMRAFWLSSYAAWEAYSALAIGVQRGTEPDYSRLRTLLASVQEILSSTNPESVTLPVGVPEPGVLADKGNDAQSRATGELAIFAVGWAFLHEVRHLRHQQDGTAAAEDDGPARRKEELSCDEFGATFLLERVDHYARQQQAPAALVRQKRQLGIHFALFSLVVMKRNDWGQSKTHPALQERINAVARYCSGDGSDVAAAIANLAYLSLRNLWPDAPGLGPLFTPKQPPAQSK